MKEKRTIAGLEVTIMDGEVIIDDTAVMELTDFCQPLFEIDFDPETGVGMEAVTYKVADCPDEDAIANAGINLHVWGQIAKWISETKVSSQCAFA